MVMENFELPLSSSWGVRGSPDKVLTLKMHEMLCVVEDDIGVSVH